MVSETIDPTSQPHDVYEKEIYSQTQNGTTPKTSSNNVHNTEKVLVQKPRKPNRILFFNNKKQKHKRNPNKFLQQTHKGFGVAPKPWRHPSRILTSALGL